MLRARASKPDLAERVHFPGYVSDADMAALFSDALALASEGWQAAIHHNSSGEEAQQLADKIRETGGRACVLQGDISKIDDVNDVVPVLEQLVKTKEPLLIVAEDVTGEALSALVVNKMRGVLDVVAIKAPGFGNRRREYTQDIAIATGASFVAEELGITLDSVTMEMLGTADRIVIAKELTTIVTDGKQQDAIDARIKQLKREADNAETDYDEEDRYSGVLTKDGKQRHEETEKTASSAPKKVMNYAAAAAKADGGKKTSPASKSPTISSENIPAEAPASVASPI